MKKSVIWSKFPFFIERQSPSDEPFVSLLRDGGYNEFGRGGVVVADNQKFFAELHNKKLFYVMLMEPDDDFPELDELGTTFRNCIMKRVRGLHGDQIHIYPLLSHEWVKQVFYNSKDLQNEAQNHPIVFVDGRRLDFMQHCMSCPCRMRLVAHECAPFHSGCEKAEAKFFDLKERPSDEWFDAHQIDLSAMHAESYREHKKMLLFDQFEKAEYRNASLDDAELERLFEKRSEKSTKAAATRKLTNLVCHQCLQFGKPGSWCNRGGVCAAAGPYLVSDFQREVERCEPWHIHVVCEKEREFQPNEFIGPWGRVINPAHMAGPSKYSPHSRIGRPEEHDDRYVDLYRIMRRGGDDSLTAPYLTVCRALKVKPAKSMRDMELRFNQGKPFARHVLAACYLIWSKRVNSVYSSYGWNGCTRYLNGLSYHPESETVRLEFGTGHWRTVRRSVDSMEKLHELEGVRYKELDLDEGRCEENRLIREIYDQTKVRMPVLALRAFYAHHNLANYPGIASIEKPEIREAIEQAWKKFKRAQRKLYPTSTTEPQSKNGLKEFVPPAKAWLSQTAALILSTPVISVACDTSVKSPSNTIANS